MLPQTQNPVKIFFFFPINEGVKCRYPQCSDNKSYLTGQVNTRPPAWNWMLAGFYSDRVGARRQYVIHSISSTVVLAAQPRCPPRVSEDEVVEVIEKILSSREVDIYPRVFKSNTPQLTPTPKTICLNKMEREQKGSSCVVHKSRIFSRREGKVAALPAAFKGLTNFLMLANRVK